ncbi:MAG: YbaK/EbsC family protein [Anaerolineales bacterium]|jgi:prolyl-tRNA editing enzyme YbaK/EbsC (Cys-tRNA(Pro) deacylase)
MINPTAQKVQEMLRSLGCDCTVIEFSESTRTAQEAAQRAGCELGQIVKSLVFRGQSSGKAILVLASGANRVDEAQLSRLTGEAIGRADANFVRSVTGYSIGGIPPVGYTQNIETYLDEDLLQYASVWAAAGTPNAIFEIPPRELLRITRARVTPIKPNP